jgi:hypothetical protein
MTKIGLIVDGLGEFAAFRARFKEGQKILKSDGPRSHTTSAAQIAGYSRKQIAMLRGYGCTRIIVVTDFEGRAESYENFVKALRKEFGCAFVGSSVEVAVPNKMIENWYLADICHIATRHRFLRRPAKQRHYEGKHGKQVLKGLFRSGHHYSEVEHGPLFFTLLRFAEAVEFSPSLRVFLKAIR